MIGSNSSGIKVLEANRASGTEWILFAALAVRCCAVRCGLVLDVWRAPAACRAL